MLPALAAIATMLAAPQPAFAQMQPGLPAAGLPQPGLPQPAAEAPLPDAPLEPTTLASVRQGAPRPAPGPFDAPAAAPAFRPELPRETPEEQLAVDPETPVTGLAAAIERAYWTNPQLIGERARARSFDYRLPQARGQYGPQLQYSGTHEYRRDSFEQAIGGSLTRSGWSSTASAILRQPLFTFGRLRAGEDGARAAIAIGQASLRSAEQDILLNTINAYSSVLRDRAGVRISADNLDLLTRQAADTQARLSARESTLTNSEQAASRLELARAQLLSAQAAAASSEAAFLRFVGSPAGTLAAPAPLPIPARTLEEAYDHAGANNPIIAAAYARERFSRAELAGARADMLPRVDLVGEANLGTVTPYSNDLRTTELRAGITISGTLDAGIRRARIGEVSAANDADWRLIDAALRDNRAELAEAWNEWKSQTAAIERLAVAVTAARRAFDGAVLQERAGLRTTLDVLDLARDLLQVRSNYNASVAAAFVAQARVLAAMGALEMRYLVPDRKAYDPRIHLDKVDKQADMPLLTPMIRALDSLTTPRRNDRSLRDPSGPVVVGPAVLP